MLRADPSRCNSTNRQNPPIQQNHRDFVEQPLALPGSANNYAYICHYWKGGKQLFCMVTGGINQSIETNFFAKIATQNMF